MKILPLQVSYILRRFRNPQVTRVSMLILHARTLKLLLLLENAELMVKNKDSKILTYQITHTYIVSYANEKMAT